MDSLTEQEAKILGVYGICRRMLLKEVIGTTAVTVNGISTTKYGSVPIKRPHTYSSAVDAAERLYYEGFYTALFYPNWDPDVLYLVVVWDRRVTGKPGTPMPCIFCSTKVPSWDKCGECEELKAWSQANQLPGQIIRQPGIKSGTSTYNPAKTATPGIGIPTAEHMRSLIDESRFFLPDDFDAPILFRVGKKLEQWPLLPHFELEPLPGVTTTKYILVSLSNREASEKEILRKPIYTLENKGYICGPVITMQGRTVLLVCWDANIAPIFPGRSPCLLDCGPGKATTDSCYCTQYDAWIANWNHTTFSMSFAEQ